MNRDTFKELARTKNLIPGIYNYCDRWCERCPYTARCMTALLEQERESSRQHSDDDNETFWNDVQDMFEATQEMLYERAEEQGIDLDTVDDTETKERYKKIDEAVEETPCVNSAHDYVMMVKEWFETSAPLFEEKGQELDKLASMELPNIDPESEARELEDMLQVIEWYFPMIYTKLARAVGEAIEEEEEAFPESLRMADCSVKIALIAIDRSMAAWSTMLQHFPDHEDTMLKMLVHLERLRQNTEQTFPNARSYIRPGFDNPLAMTEN